MQKREKSRKLLGAALGVAVMLILIIGGSSVGILQLVSNGKMSVFDGMVALVVVDIIILAIVLAAGKRLFDRIHIIVGNLGRIADGSLTLEDNRLAERRDELGEMVRSMNSLVVSFAQLITSVNNATDSLTEVSEDFNDSFRNLAAVMGIVDREVGSIGGNTASQAERTQDISIQITEMSHAIDVIAENVGMLTRSADTMKNCSETAEKIMGDLVSINQTRVRPFQR